MFTKTKIALAVVGSLLIGGVAAAQPGKAQGSGKPDFKAKKAEMIQKYDANKDGSLDKNERTVMFDDRVLARFKTMDTDGNGVLSLAEFKAAKQAQRAKLGKRHARGMHGKHGKHRGMGRGAAVGNTK